MTNVTTWADRLRTIRLGFDEDSSRQHFLDNPPKAGDTLILHMTQHNTNRYRLARVDAVKMTAKNKPSRIYLAQGDAFGGASYYISGKSTFAPGCQTRLLPLVPAVAERLTYDRDTNLTAEEIAELID